MEEETDLLNGSRKTDLKNYFSDSIDYHKREGFYWKTVGC